ARCAPSPPERRREPAGTPPAEPLRHRPRHLHTPATIEGMPRPRTGPCGHPRPYTHCCAPLHDGHPAATAEELMRSRYTAFALGPRMPPPPTRPPFLPAPTTHLPLGTPPPLHPRLRPTALLTPRGLRRRAHALPIHRLRPRPHRPPAAQLAPQHPPRPPLPRPP